MALCQIWATESDSTINRLLANLSVEEKAGQMIMVYYSPLKFLKEHGFGSVLVMGPALKHPGRLKTQIAEAQKELPLGLLTAVDQEGGKIDRISAWLKIARLPSAFEMAKMAKDSLQKMSYRIGQGMLQFGVNLNLSPVLDPAINLSGDTTFMGKDSRAFGSDSATIVASASVFSKGIQDAGAATFVKHFPGYDVQENSDLESVESKADSMQVEMGLKPFWGATPFADGIMMSSIRYPALDNEPAVFSKKLVSMARKIAKDKIIITDDLWGTSLRAWMMPGKKVYRTKYPNSNLKKLTQKAFWAGNDLLMMTFPAKAILMKKELVRLAKTNPKALQRMNESVRRILTLKYKLGLLH